MLSDEQLIALVQSKSPHDLSPEEIRQLRIRLRDSESLRTALLHTLQMESYLAQALGPEPVDPKAIVAWAKTRQMRWWAGVTTLVSALIAIPLIVLLVAILFATGRSLVNDQGQEVASNEKTTAQEKESEKTSVKPASETKTPDKVQPPTEVAKDEPNTAVVPTPAETVVAPAPPVAPVEPVLAPTGPVIPDGPWKPVFALDEKQLPAFRADAFREFADQQRPSQQDLGQWLVAVPGQPLSFTTENVHPNKSGGIKGAAKVIPPIPVGAALRLRVGNVRQLRWHVFQGLTGASFYYYPNQNDRFAAYATERLEGEGLPHRWQHVGSDEYRSWRAEVAPMATFTLYHAADEWQLWRGNVLLTSAPAVANDAPSEVTIDGDLAILGIEVARYGELPPAEWIAQTSVFHSDERFSEISIRPADLSWNTRFQFGANLARLEDGSVELDARGRKGVNMAWFDWKPIVPEEMVLHLQNLTPGTGIAIIDGDGEHYELTQTTVRSFLNQRDQQSILQTRGLDETIDLYAPPPTEGSTMYAGSEVWLRIVPCCGGFSWWSSSDGKHWGAGDPLVPLRFGKITGVGLMTVGERPASAPTVKSIMRRPIPGLAGAAPLAIVQRAGVINTQTIGAWIAEALKSKPSDVSWTQWRRACAVRSLAAGVHRELSIEIMRLLMTDVCGPSPEEPIGIPARNELLAAVSLFSPNYPRYSFTQTSQLLAQADQEFDLENYVKVRELSLSTPLAMASRADQNEHIQHEMNVLKSLVVHQDMGQVDEFVDAIRMFRWHPQNPLLDWAEMRSRGSARPGPYGPTRLRRGDAKPMFAEPASKNAYDTWAELVGMIDGNDFAAATRLMLDRPRDMREMIVSKHDPDLALGLLDAWHDELDRVPGMRQGLHAEAARAEIRIRQAIQRGDAAAIGLAATIFGDVPATVEGLTWLGDSELTRGRFELAIAYYDQAQKVADAIAVRDPSVAETIRSQTKPKSRLGQSLRGHYVADTSPVSVELGSRNIAGNAFEEVLRQLGTAHQGTEIQGAGNRPNSTRAVPPISHFKLENRAAFDGPFGNVPDQEGARFIYQWQIDWAARQMAVVVDKNAAGKNEFYLHNRFGLSRWNATDWKKVWQSEAPPGDPVRAQDWPLITMRPVVGPTHIWARQLIGKSPTLCCWEKETGKLVWRACGEEKDWLASDPVVRDGRVYGFMVARDTNQPNELSIVEWDALTGERQKESNLLVLQESWFERRCAEVVDAGDRLIVSLSGATLGCDFDGRLRWVRRNEYLATEADVYAVRQHYAPPVVVGGHVLVVQPGSPSIECLDASTGTKVWQRCWPDVCRIVGVHENLCVIACRDALAALDLSDGSMRWRLALPDLADTSYSPAHSQLVDNAIMGEGKIAVAIRRFQDRRQLRHRLGMLWIDAAKGEILGESAIETPDGDDLRLSQPFQVGDKWLATFATDRNPQRAIIELTPQTGGVLASAQYRAPWINHLKPEWWRASHTVAPGWTLASVHDANPSGLVVDVHGESKVVGIRGKANEPITLYRQASIPATGPAKLTLQVGDEPSSKWSLEVRFNDQVVSSQSYDEKSPSERWKNITVDLSPFAGKEGLVTIVATPSPGQEHALIYWKSVDLQL
jgi:outer membrane protein assembly factor BamB